MALAFTTPIWGLTNHFRTSSPLSSRRPSNFHPRCSPNRSNVHMGVYNEKDNPESPAPSSELEKIVPEPLLPTLTTLSGGVTSEQDIDLSAITTNVNEDKEEDLSLMGAGVGPSDENALVRKAIDFLIGVREEFDLVEWPSARRVIRLAVLIMVIIVVACGSLYLIDGFFYRVAQILFEGKAV